MGYETPQEITDAGLETPYQDAMQRSGEAQCRLAALPEGQLSAAYLSPLGHRQRALFKMDFSEVVYISELRTTPAGHYSYRRVAWEMYRAVTERYPAIEGCFRVHDVREPVDLLKR